LQEKKLNNINQAKAQATNCSRAGEDLKEVRPEPTLDALLKLLADYAFAKF